MCCFVIQICQRFYRAHIHYAYQVMHMDQLTSMTSMMMTYLMNRSQRFCQVHFTLKAKLSWKYDFLPWNFTRNILTLAVRERGAKYLLKVAQCDQYAMLWGTWICMLCTQKLASVSWCLNKIMKFSQFQHRGAGAANENASVRDNGGE